MRRSQDGGTDGRDFWACRGLRGCLHPARDVPQLHCPQADPLRVAGRAGRARKFSLEQVIQIAAMGQLIAGFGIHASAAADWSQAIKLPIAPRGDLLIVLDNGKATVAHKEPDETLESAIEAHVAELKLVESRYPTPFPLRCVVMDVSDLAAWVRDRLAHPDPAWRDDGPAIPELR